MYVSTIKAAVSTVDSTPTANLGDVYVDENGKEFIYALGIANTAVGSVVALGLETTKNTPITALLDATNAAYGVPVAVAMSASIADKYGWYQIYGAAEASCLISDAADAIQYTSATAGSIDDDSTSQTAIHGIRLVDTEPGTATALLTVLLTYPHTKV
jgi:hypothetical protein